jgi:hypothetical protein
MAGSRSRPSSIPVPFPRQVRVSTIDGTAARSTVERRIWTCVSAPLGHSIPHWDRDTRFPRDGARSAPCYDARARFSRHEATWTPSFSRPSTAWCSAACTR